MQFMYDIEDRVLNELKNFANKDSTQDMSAQDLDNLKDLSETLLNITTYCAMKNSPYGKNIGDYQNGISNAVRGGQMRNINRMGGMSNMADIYPRRSFRSGDEWNRGQMYYDNMRPESDMY